MGTLPIKAQFTASHGSCKDVAVFFFFINGRDYFWMMSSKEGVYAAIMSLGLRRVFELIAFYLSFSSLDF